MPISSSEPRRWNKKKRKPEPEEVTTDEDVSNDNENPNTNPALPEMISGPGVKISDFPVVVRRNVTRHHPVVMSVVAAERESRGGERSGGSREVLAMENVSYGQMQTVSRVPRDSPLLVGKGESGDVGGGGIVVKAPRIVEGRGVVKEFGGRVHVVPMHADWFSPHSVHRLERQVVPHFFRRKSAEDTPEKYMECRNRIVAKYMENPEKRLSLSDCQGWVTGFQMDDLSRVVRFLDHWGIINYCASVPINELQSDSLCIKEDSNGDILVPSIALKSIDSLIQFDKAKCKLKVADIYPSLSSRDHEEADLDSKIREHLSEQRCNYCSKPVPLVYFQSQKEDDLLLCMDCFNDGRFVPGHSSIDFVRVDASKDYGYLDGESWTNQETLLLLEAVEIYNDNWNEIAEHVGSKSKAQCILHFIRLPTEDGPLESIEVPSLSSSSNKFSEDLSVKPYSSSNGESAGLCDPDLETELPFVDSANPVMSLVAFLASAVGPRVAAASARACLAVLSEDSKNESGLIEESSVSKRTDAESIGYSHGESNIAAKQNGEKTPLSAEKVKAAVKAGLAAAATKAKLFADHEEREIQRLSANIVNHQLKRLELKLKQFAEVETVLMKECEVMEKGRQSCIGERTRMMSAAQFGNAGGNPSLAQLAMANNAMTNRQPFATAASQPFFPLGSNSQQIHSNIMGRQQMYGHGPRLPLSSLHSSGSSNAMFNSPTNPQPSSGHPMMRSLSGASSNI